MCDGLRLLSSPNPNPTLHPKNPLGTGTSRAESEILIYIVGIIHTPAQKAHGNDFKLNKVATKTAKSFDLNCKYFVETPTCVKIKS